MSLLRPVFVLMIPFLLGGCPLDSGVDAWEGVLNVDIDQDDDIAGDEVDVTNGDGFPYPEGVDRVYDLAVDGNTLWLWAEDFASSDGPVLIPFSLVTEESGESLVITDRPTGLNAGSELAWDGTAFWFTSEGGSEELVQVDRDGVVIDSVACPFAGTGGCQGVAWDGTSLWTAEQGGTQVTRVAPSTGAAIPSPFSPWDDTTISVDFLFADETADTSRALVVRNGRLDWILSSSESISAGAEVDFDRGGANSGTIWFPSDADRRIFSRSVPAAP